MIRINLLGHSTTKAKRRSLPEFKIGGSENAAFILAVVATLILVAGAWWWQSRSLNALLVRHAQVTADQLQLAETADRVRALEDRRAAISQRLDVIVDLKKSQRGPVMWLDQLSRQLPDSLWLTDVTLDGGNVSITGQALSEVAIADFDRNLSRSSYFADTNLEYTQDTANSVRFQISTRFVPLSAAEDALDADDLADPGGS